MKRLILSVIGGIAIPFLYALIVGPLTNYIENPWLRDLASYPIRWPIVTLEYFVPFSRLGFKEENELFVVLVVIVADVLLYSLMTYVLLGRFWKRKTHPLEPPPPNPPRFTSNENPEDSA